MNAQLWATEFSEPMPDGMDYWGFALKREIKWVDEDIKTCQDEQTLKRLYAQKIKLLTGGLYDERELSN